ncbi:MAG: hypothetical protein ACJAZE_000772 [Halioglobus sp.]
MDSQCSIDIMATADKFVSIGDWESALQCLMKENARQPNSALEQQLVDLRIRAFRESSWPAPDIEWPPAHDVLPASGSDLPEINPADLTVDALRSGIMGNGALVVRGLMDPHTVDRMCDNIDRTLVDRQSGGAHSDPAGQSWYQRSTQVQGGPTQFFALGREKSSESGSVWAVDSPRVASQLMEFYHSINLPGLLNAYFAEPATLSVKKWVLRKVAPNNGSKSGWHQDGRFLGDGVRTVNLWIALTECGGQAKSPGLDIVGGKNRKIFETGTHGAPFDWTVGQGLVDELGSESPVLCPRFSPGDALFFDHYNLHRTAFGDDHTENRYALESWFFAASRAPAKQMPVYF